MKRFSILSLSAVLALGVVSISASAVAQQRVTKDQLVGTWTLVSCTDANGGTRPICVNANGRTMFDAAGRYMEMGTPRGRPKCSDSCGRAQMSGDQYKAAAQGVVANFGNWSFNEADQTLTLNREAALFPNFEGRETKTKVSLTGDELRTMTETGQTIIWRRAR